jgi:hypothetical protein
MPIDGMAVSQFEELDGAAAGPARRFLAVTTPGAPVQLLPLHHAAERTVVATVRAAPIDVTRSTEAMAFDSSGHQLAIIDSAGTTRIVNVDGQGQSVETVTVTGDPATAAAAVYNPVTGELYTGGAGATIHSWDTTIDAVTRHICSLAYPRITVTEWDRYLPQTPYKPVSR